MWSTEGKMKLQLQGILATLFSDSTSIVLQHFASDGNTCKYQYIGLCHLVCVKPYN